MIARLSRILRSDVCVRAHLYPRSMWWGIRRLAVYGAAIDLGPLTVWLWLVVPPR